MTGSERNAMDTTSDMLPGGAEGADPPVRRWSRRRRRATWAVGAFVALLGVLLFAASLVSSGYVAYKPGNASPAEDRIEAHGTDTFTPAGDILFLTVSVDRMSILEKWWYDRNEDVDMVKESVAFPKGRTENRQVNAQLMTQSKSNAELAALNYLGYDVFDTTGARVVSVVDGSPAANRLQRGDTIVAIDGDAVTTREEAITVLRSTNPGQSVVLRVEGTDGATRDETVVLAPRPDSAETYGFLGVGLDDRIRQKQEMPIELEIDSGRVGGDSAGLAFTLSIIDELTAGELTGGHRIAVTGTIDPLGNVGPIGGIRQKVVAARKAKAELLLVPEGDNYDDAIAKANGSIKIVAVKDLQSALDALGDFGGNADELALAKPPVPN
jgi:PDZ domain-containing protein